MLNRTNVLILVVSTLLGLLVLEGLLRLATPYPITSNSNWADDPQLGYVLDSSFPEVDAAGFRNDGLELNDADIAVIGDSHAYGIHVFAADSYPSVLASLTGKKVYNLGISSYGIYQYKVLLDRVAESQIETVIVSLFVDNDLALYLCHVTTTEYWQNYAKLNDIQLPDCSDYDQEVAGESKQYSGLYGTATWQLVQKLLNWINKKPAPEDELMLASIDPPVLTNSERIEAIWTLSSLKNPVVATNFDNSLRFFREAKIKREKVDGNLLFVLIPSRPEVLHSSLIQREAQLSPEFASAIGELLATKERYIKFFTQESIDYIDALPYVLEAALQNETRGKKPFYDGTHPLEAGYAAYAEAALQGLQDMQRSPY